MTMAAILGASGFVGAELLRLCAAHPHIRAVRLFGDSHAYGEEGVRFYTKQKSIMQRWSDSIDAGAEFVMPTSK